MFLHSIKISDELRDERLSRHVQHLACTLQANAPEGTKPDKIARHAARIATLMAELKHPRKSRKDMIAWGDAMWELSDLLRRYGLAVAPHVDLTIVPRTGDLGDHYQRWDGAASC